MGYQELKDDLYKFSMSGRWFIRRHDQQMTSDALDAIQDLQDHTENLDTQNQDLAGKFIEVQAAYEQKAKSFEALGAGAEASERLRQSTLTELNVAREQLRRLNEERAAYVTRAEHEKVCQELDRACEEAKHYQQVAHEALRKAKDDSEAYERLLVELGKRQDELRAAQDVGNIYGRQLSELRNKLGELVGEFA